MVSPWMDPGTLSRFVLNNVDVDVDELVSLFAAPTTLFLTRAKLYGVAEGIQYLHEERVVHGDLRGVRIWFSS